MITLSEALVGQHRKYALAPETDAVSRVVKMTHWFIEQFV